MTTLLEEAYMEAMGISPSRIKKIVEQNLKVEEFKDNLKKYLSPLTVNFETEKEYINEYIIICVTDNKFGWKKKVSLDTILNVLNIGSYIEEEIKEFFIQTGACNEIQ